MYKETLYSKYIKRILDIILSLLAIIVLSPVLLITALLVRIKLGSPVIFTQVRPGKDEKLFDMYKFRTMTNDTDENGNLLENEKRTTKFGNLLRSTSLDELPELVNILIGNMSFIGPRPLLKEYLPYYTEKEQLRHMVRPGLTGLAQVMGRNTLGWDERLQFDVDYIENITFLNDLKIFLNTIKIVLKKDGYETVDNLSVERLDIERSLKR